MKKIITAIGNNILNNQLAKNKKYEILGRDIQYKEGVLEFLNERRDVNALIISEILDGEIDFKELISNILRLNENIEIIVFIEDEQSDIKSFLYKKGIYKVYSNNQVGIEEIETILDEENSKSTEILTEEIKRLKRIIEEQQINASENIKLGKVTAIVGSYGSRKKCIVLHSL